MFVIGIAKMLRFSGKNAMLVWKHCISLHCLLVRNKQWNHQNCWFYVVIKFRLSHFILINFLLIMGPAHD